MQINDLVSRDSILINLGAKTKIEALSELVDVIVQRNQNLSKDFVLSILLEREKLGSTGIGEGVAIPHGKLKNLDKVMLSFGRSQEGVPFDATDSKPVHLFFLLLAPENSAGVYLRVLAKISRLLKNPALRERLREAASEQEILDIIRSEDI